MAASRQMRRLRVVVAHKIDIFVSGVRVTRITRDIKNKRKDRLFMHTDVLTNDAVSWYCAQLFQTVYSFATIFQIFLPPPQQCIEQQETKRQLFVCVECFTHPR